MNIMKTGLIIFCLLFLSSLVAVVWAESTVDINVKNQVNTAPVTTNSTNNAKVKSHIEVEINGEKRVIDDTQEGSNINSNIKVEAKSENGQTTFNISGNPQSVKSGTTSSNLNAQAQPAAQTQPTQEKKEDKSLITKIVDFFKEVISYLLPG